jgi:uncharacterized membrane protein YukC
MKKVLKTLASIVWYIGFIALSFKSYRLFSEAYLIDANVWYIIMFLTIGVLLALVKTKYIFVHSYNRNLARIEALEHPKIWQFYRVGFFIFLAVVISLGAFLSRMASGDYWFLVAVGVVDMALALALLIAGFEYCRVFFQKP